MSAPKAVTVAVPKPLHQDLSKMAESKYMTTSQLVRMALAEYVKNNQ